MKQTAVEWLLDNLLSEPWTEKHFEYNAECWDKALEMEKQQIVDAWNNGFEENRPYVDHSEDYYNETFKQQSVTDDTL
jgi:hypothetical protein